MDYIDLRSDTITQPLQSMRDCLLTVQLGDDEYGEDPTVNKLQTLAAQIFGKQAACLVPSGNFGNQCAILTHMRPGQEIVLADCSHMIQMENGSLGRIARVLTRTLKSKSGLLDPADVEKAIVASKASIFRPQPTSLLLEYPTSYGRCYQLSQFQELCQIAKQHNLVVHVDGARIFNACDSTGVDPKEIGKHVDSIMFCLSKGLCAPAGSMVVGSKAFITEFKKNRKILGGGMNQLGVIAGPGIIALTEIRPQIGVDNQMAQLLKKKLEALKWVSIIELVDTTLVFLKIVNVKLGFHPAGLRNHLKENKILMLISDSVHDPIRMITHYYTREKQVERVVEVMDAYMRKHLKSK